MVEKMIRTYLNSNLDDEVLENIWKVVSYGIIDEADWEKFLEATRGWMYDHGADVIVKDNRLNVIFKRNSEGYWVKA